VGDKVAALFKRMGVESVEDLIYHFPRRYDDYSHVVKINNIKPGPVTIKVEVKDVQQRYVRRGLHITEAVVKDPSGTLKITWFNQPYRAKALMPDKQYFISGDYQFNRDRYSIINPAAELVSSFPKNTARIVPIYPETKRLKSFQIRRAMQEVLPVIARLQDNLPAFIVKDFGLLPLNQALKQLHFPDDPTNLTAARDRLGFAELFELTLAGQLNKLAIAAQSGQTIKFDEALAKRFVASLAYKLTDAQRKAAWQLLQDLNNKRPMNRLLEGDVGSGKTIVAAMAILMAANNGYQVAYMAPTEILAHQQHETLGSMLSPFGVKTDIFTGSLNEKRKMKTAKSIESGEPDLIVGTHALIQKHPKFKNLSLVIIDEQHRFGVNQREKLLGKATKVPHVLTMTATPIPRSLALTIYGELDISIIDELPPGRQPIITEVIPPESRPSVYSKIDQQIAAGRQAYVICPLVDDSDVLGVKSVNEEFRRLNSGLFKHRRIGLMHGRLKSDDKNRIMTDFSTGLYDILVSTTVVEVGVDVPNAAVMLIEGAERFGLAQLHQLRGRVGRGEYQSYCFAIPSTNQQLSRRLRAFAQMRDGFKLAEMDLKLRGPGEVYGLAQHGVLDLRMAKLSDAKLLARVRQAADDTLLRSPDLLQYPRLKKRVNDLRKITNLN